MSLLFDLQKGFTPLHIAAKYGQLKVAKLLLQKEANPDIQGKNGLTPLHVATHYNHVSVALLLLNNKASPHATAKVKQLFVVSLSYNWSNILVEAPCGSVFRC